MTDQAADKRSPIIVGALILTAAFLVTFGWLLSRTDTCPAGWWLWDRLSCLEPNALGDTFAGAFAPVAFVWLVAAVLLQRNELAAQRQELRESREVSIQQVAEARKNVELIGEQTAILKRQGEQEAKADADKAISTLLLLFDKTMMITVDGFLVKDRNAPPAEDGWASEEDCKTIGFTGPASRVNEERCRELIDQIDLMHFEIMGIWPSTAKVEFQGSETLGGAIEILKKIVGEYSNASIPVQGMLDFVGVKKGLTAGEELLAWLPSHGRPIGGLFSLLEQNPK